MLAARPPSVLRDRQNDPSSPRPAPATHKIARVPVPPLIPVSQSAPPPPSAPSTRVLLDNVCLADEGFMRWSAQRYIAPSMPDTYDRARAPAHDTLIHDIRFSGGRALVKCVALLARDTLALLPAEPIPLPPPPPPVPSASGDPTLLPFKLSLSPGSGLGLFATRALAPGQLVVREPPLLLVPLVVPLAGPPGRGLSKAHIFRALFARHDPRTRRLLLSLADATPAGACSREEGIVRTNGIGVALRVGAPPVRALKHHHGLNHEHEHGDAQRHLPHRQPREPQLQPQRRLHLAPAPLRALARRPAPHPRRRGAHGRVHDAHRARGLAPRDAARGVPLCVRVRAVRGEEGGGEVLVSDQNRIELDGWRVGARGERGGLGIGIELVDTGARSGEGRAAAGRAGAIRGAVGAHVRALEMMEAEGLYAGRAAHCEAVARAYGALGERGAFVAWAGRAAREWAGAVLEVDVETGGTGEEEEREERVRRCEGWVREPEGFEWWGVVVGTGA